MPDIFEYSLTVPPDAIDGQGHVNNLEYLRWMQSAAVAHSAAQGWTADRYQQLGAGWVVRSHRIEYFQPSFAGDELTVRTWVANFRNVRSLRKYEILRPDDSVLLVQAETDWVFVDYKKRNPRRVPREVSEAFIVVDANNEPT